VSKRKEIAKLVKSVFGDDPKWAREATRIEQQVAAGDIEGADVSLAHLAFDRLAGTRNGIDVAIARAATALAVAYMDRGENEEVRRVLGMFEVGEWDPRATSMIEALSRRDIRT
jgi:hypothetical protein